MLWLVQHSYKIDLTGHTYGRWLVIEPAPMLGRRKRWLCRCVCGGEKVVLAQSLRNGSSGSCGCLARERQSAAGKGTHGLSRTPEFNAWSHARQRCLFEHHRLYSDYGGRGIQFCARWQGAHGFEAFLSDMGPRPSPQHSLDRIDNDGNYEPGNCRWATGAEQYRNRRCTSDPCAAARTTLQARIIELEQQLRLCTSTQGRHT